MAGAAGIFRRKRPAEYHARALRKLQQKQVRHVHEGVGSRLRQARSSVSASVPRGWSYACQTRHCHIRNGAQCIYLFILLYYFLYELLLTVKKNFYFISFVLESHDRFIYIFCFKNMILSLANFSKKFDLIIIES